ncbi:MAG: hypothetical protein ICV73_12990 [Acetobacteraceae bacterium]|nr:hypothetical protein [Acetobacteraceae bacterium]
MQRTACTPIVRAPSVVRRLVALSLKDDAPLPGRVPPMLAFYAACGTDAFLSPAWPCWNGEAPRTAPPLRKGIERRDRSGFRRSPSGVQREQAASHRIAP